MKHAYLEVTFRKGRPLAAYYYLPRRVGDVSARTESCAEGLIIDFAADGRAIGIEITTPLRFDPAKFNQVLARLGHSPVDNEDLRPLSAA